VVRDTSCCRLSCIGADGLVKIDLSEWERMWATLIEAG